MLRHEMRGQRQWAALWILNEQLCSVPKHWLRSLCTIMSLCDRTWLTGGWLIFVITSHFMETCSLTLWLLTVCMLSTKWVGQLKNNAIEPWKTLSYQTTFSWNSGWEMKWSAAGLTFLFQVNLDGDEVFKEHIVDVGVILLKEVFEFSRLRIFYKIKTTMNQIVVFFWNHFCTIIQFKTELFSYWLK